MAAATIFLDKRRVNKNGTYPLKIRIVHKNGNVCLSMNKNIPDECWIMGKNGMQISSDFPNYKALNSDILYNIAKIRKIIDSLTQSGKINRMNASDIKKYILKSAGKEQTEYSFLSYFKKFAESRNAESTQKIYFDTYKKIEKYTGDFLEFEDITVSWLEDFNTYLTKRGYSINTRAMDERNIRAVIKSAIRAEITNTHDPFTRYKIKCRYESATMPLTVEQIRKIRDFKTDKKHLEFARDVFMITFYLIGINVSDLYNLKKSDRAKYIRNKTGMPANIALQPEIELLIKKYPDDNYMFSFRSIYSTLKSFKSMVNRHLKTIGKEIGEPNLILYHARHTWSGIAAYLEIEEKTIARALTHQVKSVTNIYTRFDNSKIDKANRKVINFLNKKV